MIALWSIDYELFMVYVCFSVAQAPSGKLLGISGELL
jgi:hypothetical protein